MVNPQNLNSKSNMSMNNYPLEDLRKEYIKYKEKKYEFGKYETEYQIKKEFLKGKIFILKGGIRGTDWFAIFLFFGFGIVLGFTFFLTTDFMFGFFTLCLFLAIPSLFFLKLRNVLIISTFGVYYRKFFSSGTFSWNYVEDIRKVSLGLFKASSFKMGYIKLYGSYGNTIEFGCYNYLNKEFEKKFEQRLFFSLFVIYSGINTKKLSRIPSISDRKKENSKIAPEGRSQKFPPISELLKKTKSSR